MQHWKQAKRLAEEGIVLETNMMWEAVIGNDHKQYYVLKEHFGDIPAPSMAEVWRKLPEGARIRRLGNGSVAGTNDAKIPEIQTNPTDALIDLLIWVRKA